MMKKTFFIFCIVVVLGSVLFFILKQDRTSGSFAGEQRQSAQVGNSLGQTSTSQSLPPKVLLNDGGYYVTQTFNNCGPAALSIDLSFYGVHVDQQTLADALRPTNNTTGKDDDKSTPPDEIAAQAGTYGLVAYFRPGGNIDLLKRLIAAGFPVMTRTLLNTSEDFAHYRVIKGYDDTKGELTDEDGFQGENVNFSYSDFLAIWKPFNYEYVVFAPSNEQTEVESILGNDVNATTAWKEAAQAAGQVVAADPKDASAQFDLSVADYYISDYTDSVRAFEAAQPSLSEHALWYQIEPIESYYELGDYDKVFSLAKSILSDNNPAYPELYVIEGESYLKEGDNASAKTAFETALHYNKNLKSAQDGLASVAD